MSAVYILWRGVAPCSSTEGKPPSSNTAEEADAFAGAPQRLKAWEEEQIHPSFADKA